MRCLVVGLLFFSASLFAQVAQKLANGQLAYYGDGFSPKTATKNSLFTILDQNHQIRPGKTDFIGLVCTGQCYRHMSVGYDGARRILFGELFVQKAENRKFVQDVYCGKKFYFQDIQDVSNMHSQVNIEHTWPQSKFTGKFDKNMQKSDMHHLYPTDSLANSRRGNFEFGDYENNQDELNVQNCSNSKLTDISGHFIFTPPTQHRGNVARSLFYFATRYDLFIGKAEEMILKQWHRSDPVDEAEKQRHEIIAKYQNVRNPFVDYPELVERVSDF